MIIQDFLATKEIKNPSSFFQNALNKAKSKNGNFVTQLFKKPSISQNSVDIGRLLISNINVNFNVKKQNEIDDQLKKLVSDEVWQEGGFQKILIEIQDEKFASYAKCAWDTLPGCIYQKGYLRRSFRAPHIQKYNVLKQIDFLKYLFSFPSVYNYQEGRQIYYRLSLDEHIRLDYLLNSSGTEYLIWSEALKSGDQSVYQVFEDIIYNRDEVGKVSRNIILALLNSNVEKCWKLVENLLLSAQRQEGLRQTILEALDETNVHALRYIIKIILDHKLVRFSSVKRAIDTWMGLGLSAEKDKTFIRLLELAYFNLGNKNIIETEIDHADNLNVYLALWATAVFDVEETIPYLKTLSGSNSVEKRMLAMYFLNEIAISEIEMPFYYEAVKDGNLKVLAFVSSKMKNILALNVNSNYFVHGIEYEGLFETIFSLVEKVNVKEIEVSGKPFHWTKAKFQKEHLFHALIYLINKEKDKRDRLLEVFEEQAISVRESLAALVFKEFQNYTGARHANLKVSDEQKNFALRVVKDRSEAILSAAFNVLKKADLNKEEILTFFDLYNRKNQGLRKKVSELILLQPDKTISWFIDKLISEGNEVQRLAALDLIANLKNKKRNLSKLEIWVDQLRENPKLSGIETLNLDQINPQKDQVIPTEKNGFGVFDPTICSPYSLPEVDRNGIYATLTKSNKFGLSKSLTEIKADLLNLKARFDENKTFEYTIEHWDNSKNTVLLGNELSYSTYRIEGLSKEERFARFPLSHIWAEWFESSNLQPVDLFLLTFCYLGSEEALVSYLEKFIVYGKKVIPDGEGGRFQYYWRNPHLKILEVLSHRFPFEQKNEFLLGLLSVIYKNLPSSIKSFRPPSNDYNSFYYQNHGCWQKQNDFLIFEQNLDVRSLDDSNFTKIWNLARWRQFNGLPEMSKICQPELYLFCRAFKLNLISKDELIGGILTTENIKTLTEKKTHIYHKNKIQWFDEFSFLIPIITHIQRTFIDFELKRGDLSTNVTQFVQSFNSLYGVNYLIELINALGKTPLFSGYIYMWSMDGLNRQQLYSYLIKICFPNDSESQELFNDLVKTNKISEERLVQIAIYAPQWQKFISTYLDWPGLNSGIWWMHAHSKNAAFNNINAQLESEVSKFSDIDIQDFKDGCVDKNWFFEAYTKLGEKKWKLLYKAAKYITDGNGHRRIKLYSDVLTKSIKLEDVIQKIRDKRDQDFVRIFGVVPFEGNNINKEVLSRFEFLSNFKKESRQFGSMKQSSESVAYKVAMENLARNAGYSDPMRLVWAMETEQVKDLLTKDSKKVIKDYSVEIEIDHDGKANLLISKDGKIIKSTPKSIKKEVDYLYMVGIRKKLREQWTRSRKGLEEAMLRRDIFSLEEFLNLSKHLVIARHIEKLFFMLDSKDIIVYRNGEAFDINNKVFHLEKIKSLKIAHSVDFNNSKDWAKYQKYIFDHKIKQPFKQVFRELYTVTEDELTEKTISRRFAGHQIQPQQSLALLKSRGWKLDYESGLQKGFHKDGYSAKIYAQADWFSPADIESPTIETVEFQALNDYKSIPFQEIDPVDFSEVMRDVDLVVSVAHVGGVDPEASQSTIEMRSVIMNETLNLMKISNAEVSKNHVLITGKLANYSIHLGSGIVHQMPGNYIAIIPIHSQQRGRVFLPFLDDDPKTAEIISKVILLSNDSKIQDPTIISQISLK